MLFLLLLLREILNFNDKIRSLARSLVGCNIFSFNILLHASG